MSQKSTHEEYTDKIWSREAIMRVENQVINNVFGCRTPEAVEAAITYVRFLRLSGLTNENYPLFLKILEIDNHWVIDTLIGTGDPFLLLTPIQPTRNLVGTCFRLLTNWHPGGIYPKTLSITLGVLQVAYCAPKDGYDIHPISINDVNNLGKHLNKDLGQDDPVNRTILDILDKVHQLEGIGDDSMERVARQATLIRSNFFDRRKKLEDAIPQVLLVKSDYLAKEIPPSRVFE